MAIKCEKEAAEVVVVETDPEPSKKDYKRHFLVFGSLLSLLLLSIVIWMIVLLIKYETPNFTNFVVAPPATTPAEFEGAEGFADFRNATNQPRIISRREWLASPPQAPLTALNHPVPYVIIMHSATEKCAAIPSCTSHVRLMQSFAMEARNWDDIAYSFLVGGDGNVYEGRGWMYVGAQVLGYNSRCIGIAFIGSFDNEPPPQRQIEAAQSLIRKGVDLGYIGRNYKLIGARQVQTTRSPGDALFENVRTWPHWTNDP